MAAIFEQFALLTRLLGEPVSAQALASQTLRKPDGRVDLQNLGEILRSQGWENQLNRRPLEQIPAAAAPLLLILKEEGAVVVSGVQHHVNGTRRYEILNADGSRQVWSQEDLEAVYIGYCWFVKLKPQQDRRSELPEYAMRKGWFWKVIWRYRSYYWQVILASVLINLLALIGSLYVMNVYDRVIPNKAYETLWVLSIGVLVANLFEFVARFIRARLTDIAGKKADLVISSALFRRVMAMELTAKPASSGSYASNLRDFESVRDFMTSASLLALVDLPFIFLFIFVMWMVAGTLALVPLTIVPLVVLVGILAQGPLARYTLASMRESSQRQGLAVESIEGLETLKAHNATNWAQQRWDRFTASSAALSIQLKDWSNVVTNFATLMQQFNTVFLVLYGTYLIHSDNPASRISMGALIACVILSGRMLSPLSQVAGLMVRFQQAKVALGGLDEVVSRKTERDPDRTYLSLPHVVGKIEFQDVSFSYGEQGPVALQGVNLRFKPGEKVAILGRIGSGKSTLLRLMAGLYPASQGNVLLDGMDTRQIDPADLRSHVSLLGQEPRLFMASLRDNLEMGRMDRLSNDAELFAALARFGLDKLVQSHPLGLNLPIGEDGHGLSGGQKQIVSLARLTLRDPGVVLLDEPTSSLDDMTERNALRALREWALDRTMIIVTHRAQVLPFVDRIIVMDQGRIAMDGPRDAVLARLRGGAAAQGQPQMQQKSGQTTQVLAKKLVLGPNNSGAAAQAPETGPQPAGPQGSDTPAAPTAPTVKRAAQPQVRIVRTSPAPAKPGEPPVKPAAGDTAAAPAPPKPSSPPPPPQSAGDDHAQ